MRARTPHRRPRHLAGAAVLAAGTLALGLALPTPAEACGGFFCNRSNPVDQTGERVLFAVQDGTVRATVEISYAGPAEDFGWVLPVPSEPSKVQVAPQAIFDRLQQRTQPQFVPQWDYQNSGQCMPRRMAAAEADGGSGGRDDSSSVDVVDEKSVGPFDTVTLDADNAAKLYDWLIEHGYDQPEEAQSLLEHYVDKGHLFVAVKLQSDASSGEIQPLTVQFPHEDPCIPLTLTQIAASENMPVETYVLGEHRAVPTNWMHVEINQKKIDWLRWGSNYDEVLSDAVDEAAGHAFVTEYAKSPDWLRGLLWTEDRYDLDALAEAQSPGQLLQELLSQGFPRGGQMQALIRNHIPKPDDSELPPECQGAGNYYRASNVDECLQHLDDPDWTFAPGEFAADVEAQIVEPMRRMQEVLDDFDYLTRLYSTVSPNEMTRDPIFAFNPDLPDVDNVHEADIVAECSGPEDVTELQITLESGETYTVDGPDSPWDPIPAESMPDGPDAASIEMLGRGGQPQPVPRGQVQLVDERLDEDAPSHVLTDLATGQLLANNDGNGQPGGSDDDGSGNGVGNGPGAGPDCRAADGHAPWSALLLVLGGLGLRRRRSLGTGSVRVRG